MSTTSTTIINTQIKPQPSVQSSLQSSSIPNPIQKAPISSSIFQSYLKPGKSSLQVFWLRIMHQIIRPRFLKVKQRQQNYCLSLNKFQQFMQCYQYQKNKLQEDTIQMQFFYRKFQTCIIEGHKALYPPNRVEEICSNKIINVIKEQTKIRREKEKVQKQVKNVNQITGNNQQNNNISTSSTIIQGSKNNQQFQGRKLSWEEQKSIAKSNLFK